MNESTTVHDAGDTITLFDAFRAMRLFLEEYWERGDRQDVGIANLLSWTAMDPAATSRGKFGTADPAQRDDWLNAVAMVVEPTVQ